MRVKHLLCVFDWLLFMCLLTNRWFGFDVLRGGYPEYVRSLIVVTVLLALACRNVGSSYCPQSNL